MQIPHPYPAGAVATWISSHADDWARGEALDLAVERRADGALLGAIGLGLEPDHARAQLGYWVGRPYWGNGYSLKWGRRLDEGAYGILREEFLGA